MALGRPKLDCCAARSRAESIGSRNLVVSRTQDWSRLEAAGHWDRSTPHAGGNQLGRLATIFRACRPSCRSSKAVPLAVASNRGHRVSFGCGAKPVGRAISIAVPDAQGLAVTFAAAGCLSGRTCAATTAPATTAAATTPTTAIHVWRTLESVGL